MAKPLLERLLADEANAITVVNGGMVRVCFADGLSQQYELSAQRLQQWIDQQQAISVSFVTECVDMMYKYHQRYGC